MQVTHSQYRDARDALDYIESIKQEISNLLYSKTHLMYSGMHLSTEDFTHASLCINEIIDDLFRFHLREASHKVETWQQQDRQDAEREWRNPGG